MTKFLFLICLLPSVAFSHPDVARAEKLFKSGNIQQAKASFEAILKTSPNNLTALEYLGDIAGNEKKWQTALLYYKHARDLKPSAADYHYKYGGVLGMIAKESNKFKALSMI